jgi:hypothetical protein
MAISYRPYVDQLAQPTAPFSLIHEAFERANWHRSAEKGKKRYLNENRGEVTYQVEKLPNPDTTPTDVYRHGGSYRMGWPNYKRNGVHYDPMSKFDRIVVEGGLNGKGFVPYKSYQVNLPNKPTRRGMIIQPLPDGPKAVLKISDGRHLATFNGRYDLGISNHIPELGDAGGSVSVTVKPYSDTHWASWTRFRPSIGSKKADGSPLRRIMTRQRTPRNPDKFSDWPSLDVKRFIPKLPYGQTIDRY